MNVNLNNPKYLTDSYFNSLFSKSDYVQENNSNINKNDYFPDLAKTKNKFLKCNKHPLFDLLSICLEKKCEERSAICIECMNDHHFGHKTDSILNFTKLKKKIIFNEINSQNEKKFTAKKKIIEENIEKITSNLFKLEKFISDFIKNINAKFKTDLSYFWKSLQEYPPFKLTHIYEKIQANSINTIKVLNHNLNYLLQYNNQQEMTEINKLIENDIDETINNIIKNMEYNFKKIKETEKKLKEVINSLNFDKIPIYHSNFLPKNDSLISKYEEEDLTNILNYDTKKRILENPPFDPESIKPNKKVVSFKNEYTSSIYFRHLPINKNHGLEIKSSISIHKAPIFNIITLNDLSTFVSVSADHTIKIYDYQKERMITSLYSHSGSVNDVIYLRNQDYFATSSSDCSIKIWNNKTYMLLQSIDAHDLWVQPLISFDNSNFIVSGGGDQKIKIWDLNIKKCVNQFLEHDKGVNSLCKIDFNCFISSAYDNNLKIWDYRMDKSVKTIKNDGDYLNKIIYIEDLNYIICGFQDGFVKMYDRNTLECIYSRRVHLGACPSLEYFHDGSTICSGGEDNILKMWNIKNGKEIWKSDEHRECVQCICYANDGQTVFTGSIDKTIKLWKIKKNYF